jgi:hypothetical protein
VRSRSFSRETIARVSVAAALAATLLTFQVAVSSAATTHRGKHKSQTAHKHKMHSAEAHGSATGLGQLSGLLPRNKLTRVAGAGDDSPIAAGSSDPHAPSRARNAAALALSSRGIEAAAQA